MYKILKDAERLINGATSMQYAVMELRMQIKALVMERDDLRAELVACKEAREEEEAEAEKKGE